MNAVMTTRQKGVAIVEFALILPLLLILIFITTEFGRAVYQYSTLTKSVRNAVRYLSVQTPGTRTTEAKNLVVYGNTSGTGSPLVVGLALSNVPTPTWQAAGTVPVINTVRVSITGYVFRPLVSGAFGVSFSNLTYNDITATMRSQL